MQRHVQQSTFLPEAWSDVDDLQNSYNMDLAVFVNKLVKDAAIPRVRRHTTL